jgi:hypothetical protein
MTQRERTIEEQVVEGRRLGRHVFHDERSKNFEAGLAPKIKNVDHASQGLPLNQGDVGSCTAEATCAALNTDPDAEHLKGSVKGHIFTQDDAYKLYGKETANEGQPWPPNDPGGTGLWVCKAAKQLGWITSYHHAFGLQMALKALVLRPNIWGMNWYSSYDTPDPETGIVRLTPGAYIRGGHEICAVQIVLKGTDIPGTSVTAPDDLVGFWQSWGGWGLHGTGRFYATFADLDRLLGEQGDVTVPMP